MSKKYYIQNTYTSDIRIDLKKDGRFSKSVVFGRYIMNRATGSIEQDGFTEIDEELYNELKGSLSFTVLVKKGKLVVKDEAPLKAGSFTQLLEMKARIKELEDENAALKAEVAELKGGKGEATTEAADDGLDKLKLDELKAKAKELGLDAEALTKKAEVIALIREASAGDK